MTVRVNEQDCRLWPISGSRPVAECSSVQRDSSAVDMVTSCYEGALSRPCYPHHCNEEVIWPYRGDYAVCILDVRSHFRPRVLDQEFK